MSTERPIAIGCMRLSTERDRDDSRSVAVLHAAFDAGITFLDTADAYCWDERERGHNERLIAHALSTWSGDRSRILVATKGGMTRPDGRWQPDGRAKHLLAACEHSCRALGVERIDLYQLHTPDPARPLATSVGALASLKRDGLIERIGLCNVTVGQIEQARRIAEIDSVQMELSIWHDEHFLSGVAEYCVANGLRLLAHRPLGGQRSRSRTARNPTLSAIAARHGATPFEIALAWLADLSDLIVPIPGVTRIETAASVARAARIELRDEDRDALDHLCPGCRVLRLPALQRPSRNCREDAEVVLVMGLPGAGKTTLAESLATDRYQRLNRDEADGSLRDLVPALEAALDSGASRIVLDNTYVSRKSRAPVILAASDRGVPVRCVWLSTSVEDAQVNAAWRLASRYGRLGDERELASLRKHDLAAFLPTVQFRYQRELEPPEASEGFSRVDVVPFERRTDDRHVNRAVIVWCDNILIRSVSGQRVPLTTEDMVVTVDRASILRRYQDQGFRMLGMSWQPQIGDGRGTAAAADAIFTRLNELMGLEIDVVYCAHTAGPPRCWCRKPLPGLGVLLIQRHLLKPSECIFVGEGPLDPGFARKLGFQYRTASEFFGTQAP